MRTRLGWFIGLSLAVIPLVPAVGQQTRDSTVVELEPVVVTATRAPRGTLRLPVPAVVTDSVAIHRSLANGIADLLRNAPGVDVTGVGPNQGRIAIRGERGQRILLLEDGIRMNNARRQQDFGELPALVDPGAVARVEVIRGPASVLYGTDAIGGVVNFISPDLGFTTEALRLHGAAEYRYGSAGDQQQPSFLLQGRGARVSFALRGAFRDAAPYSAPAGTYGGITLGSDAKVRESGVQDQHYDARLAVRLADGHRLTASVGRYRADDAGFGYMANADLGADGAPTISITYPRQTVNRWRMGYQATGLSSAVADRLDVTAYRVGNTRRLNLDVYIPFGPTAGLQSDLRNFTDLTTTGTRIEAAKVLTGRHTLTYGLDFFLDLSENTDSSANTITGFGPPQTEVSTTPQVPNASFRSLGFFAQGDLAVTDRLNAVLGVRYQHIRAATRPTQGITDPLTSGSDATVVASANLGWTVAPSLTLIGSLGRGFRAPNLVERFFNGPTPEGTGYQIRNPDLEPETSLNVDLGARVRTGRVMLEGFVFHNVIRNGIRIEPTGEMVSGFPAYRNVNVDKIRDQGIEFQGDVALGAGFSVAATWTLLDSDNVLEENNPVGDTYSRKATLEGRYEDLAGRFWLSYHLRHNGERSDVLLEDNPIGDVFPAFTVHTVRGGVRLFTSGRLAHSLTVGVQNLTNRLYAEFSNAAFFRPEPKRTLVVAWRTGW